MCFLNSFFHDTFNIVYIDISFLNTPLLLLSDIINRRPIYPISSIWLEVLGFEIFFGLKSVIPKNFQSDSPTLEIVTTLTPDIFLILKLSQYRA